MFNLYRFLSTYFYLLSLEIWKQLDPLIAGIWALLSRDNREFSTSICIVRYIFVSVFNLYLVELYTYIYLVSLEIWKQLDPLIAGIWAPLSRDNREFSTSICIVTYYSFLWNSLVSRLRYSTLPYTSPYLALYCRE